MFKVQVWNQQWFTILICNDRAAAFRDKANRQLFAMIVPPLRVVDAEGNEYVSSVS